MQAIREDCLNHKPSSISTRSFCLSFWDFFNFFLLHPIPWLTVKDYFPFYLYPFTVYFYMQRYSKDHYMQLKSRTMIFCWQKHCRSHLWWHVLIGYSHFGGLKSLKKFSFWKNVFVNSSCGSQYWFLLRYLLETAVKIIMLRLSWQKNWEKISGHLKVHWIS